jgi:MoaA/NifB/PqqE/SkfB family radical SAM enzyme
MHINLDLATIWLKNIYKARLRNDPQLLPMGITWHATNRCNFRCGFCDDGRGNRYPDKKSYTMSTEEVRHVLSLARARVPLLYVTGGEPLIRKDLAEILRWAKEEARFRYIGLVTNGALLHRQEDLLAHIDDLTISMHALDEQRGDAIYGAGPGSCRAVREAVVRYSGLARSLGYRFCVSCVVIPPRIQDARDVLHFCIENDIGYSVMPQSINPYPHPDLKDNPDYVALIDEVLALKRRGGPIYGSSAYLRCIRDFSRFSCYPTAAPRIYPNGDLVYPCTPLGKVAGNLIRASSFDEVLEEGIARHGRVPACDSRCFAQCFIEISNAINCPAELLWENLRLIARGGKGRSPAARRSGATDTTARGRARAA